jgi:hypothetical protein
MNETLGTDIDASSGRYTVEGEVANPTFRRYQTIRLFHLPRPIEPAEITHNSASPAVFTKTGHGLNDGDFVQIVNEETGKIEDNLYKVHSKATNTFQLYTTGTGSASQTYSTAVAGDTGTRAMLLDDADGVSDSDTTFAVDTMTSGGDDPSDEVEVGSYITAGGEIMRVTAVGSTSITVTREALGTTALSLSDNTVLNHARSAFIQMRTDKLMHCYFYGKVDTIDVSYSDAVGKTIHIQASDYLLTLANNPVTKVIQHSTKACEDFTTTRLTTVDPKDDDEEQGKFRNAVYTNRKYSDTIKDILSDWSFGKTLHTDNTSDGSTSIGIDKFEDSDFQFASGDLATKKNFGGTNTTGLQAAISVAMMERHSNGGATQADATVTYGTHGSLVDTGDDQDVIINDNAHGYVAGNMVHISGDNYPEDLDPGPIQSGAYIVHTVTTNNFKLKNLNGSTLQSTADDNSPTARTVDIRPEPSGAQGYDFNLDTGLYSVGTGQQNLPFAGHSEDAHRPHLNYFMRGSRPIDPEATGLSVVYPTSENQSEDDTTFGSTKEFILPDFDHGLFDEDLYTQVALTVVDDNGEPSNANELGHKMEMLKVNSISEQDYTADRSFDFYKQQASGETNGRGAFHWNRADDVRTYKWDASGDDEGDKINLKNRHFFGGTGTESTAPDHNGDKAGLYQSQGTVGVIEGYGQGGAQGGFIDDVTTGMAGYSNLPLAGRPLKAPPDTAASTKINKWADALHVKGVGVETLDDDEAANIHPGAHALVGANLIKDVYNCEIEGLLGATATNSHNGSASEIIVDAGSGNSHGLESGTLIKVVNISGTTSGDYYGIKVGTAPTRTNGVFADTTDTGSYYRVERVNEETFKIQLPQKHKSHYRAANGDVTNTLSFSETRIGATFQYKPVFNVFKEVCRVQWQSGYDWTTEEDLTVLRTSTTGKGAQTMLISDVVKNDRPYRSIQVNALLAGDTILPGNDSSLSHPVDFYTSGTTEQYSYFGFATVPFSLRLDYMSGAGGACTANAERLGTDVDDDVPVQFKYGDYISETRFLYGDGTTANAASGTGIIGVVGRDRDTDAGGSGGGNQTTANDSSQDVFKNVNCKVIERFADKRSISKTYNLKYNENYQDANVIRESAASILGRVIVPARRTTFNIFGYPTIKLTGQGQDSTTGTTLVPAADPSSFGGRAGMLVEKLDGADGSGGAMVASSLVPSIASGGNINAPLDDASGWNVGDYYRAFIYLRAGSSVRVVHPAAGTTGNMIITGLKYSERGGNAKTSVSTTGYDENYLNQQHSPLAQLRATINASGSQTQPIIKSFRQVVSLGVTTGSIDAAVLQQGNAFTTDDP